MIASTDMSGSPGPATQRAGAAGQPQAPSPDERLPRIVCYHQTLWDGDNYVSMLPLSRGGRRTTHVIIAAIHINQNAGNLTLNDDPWDAPKHVRVWQEVRLLQKDGVKVLGMLGGAAKGSFTRLDIPVDYFFHAFYDPLRDMIAATGLDGLDLDVEEPMSLQGIVRLIDQLRVDFGSEFIISLAPVCAALQNRRHLSGFDYEALEAARGEDIAFYNTQFYNGWGYVEDTTDWDKIMLRGWPARKVVVGVLTNPESGRGWVPDDMLRSTLHAIRCKHADFGGAMGWEYFNSLTAACPYGLPWSWSDLLTDILYPEESESDGTESTVVQSGAV